MTAVQLKGNLMLCEEGGTLTDYSDAVSSMVISRSRNSVTEPATLSSGRESEKAGTLTETLTINFFSDMAAASVWAVLYDVLDTDSSEIDFQGTFDDGALSADNPSFTGVATLMSLDTGADVGTLRQQSITLPITAAGITKAIA